MQEQHSFPNISHNTTAASTQQRQLCSNRSAAIRSFGSIFIISSSSLAVSEGGSDGGLGLQRRNGGTGFSLTTVGGFRGRSALIAASLGQIAHLQWLTAGRRAAPDRRVATDAAAGR
ncbi:hypothetical protein J5N97_017605 [Dioscorea zingiberensis]|uniref:Uncharacterized protein n=1 Tax=Dioscorea zingiberensis TaxID=325984 RepID=A0A9D5CPE0_9LILI|nr:hypothetical protein J5N97_017605 [Dioscorea zingiberensis]